MHLNARLSILCAASVMPVCLGIFRGQPTNTLRRLRIIAESGANCGMGREGGREVGVTGTATDKANIGQLLLARF